MWRVQKPGSPPFLASGEELVTQAIRMSSQALADNQVFDGASAQEAKEYLESHGVQVDLV